MIGIKLNGRFLDLKKDTSLEIERKNPFFAINDYASEVSTEPLTFPYTPNNALALDLPYQYYTERKKKKFDAELYDNNSFRGRCTLIIETGSINVTDIQKTEISGYVVYGISNFFQEIKGKKLKDLKLGGVRNFSFTTNNPTDGSNGYWQHFHQTWTDDSIPYVFAPVRNEDFFGEDGPDWMNKLSNDAKLFFGFDSPIVPFIRLRYLVQQIFTEAGYTVDLTDLDGTGWEKLVLINLVKLNWTTINPVTINNSAVLQPGPAKMVSINLANHVPQDKTISDFIVQMFGRYGWMPLFSAASRRCRLVSVRNYGKGKKRDWTPYANPRLSSGFNQDKKVFAFKNNIDPNDAYPNPPDFTNISFNLPAATIRFVTSPTASIEGRVLFAHIENAWYQAQLNDDTNLYEWVKFADNIYNEDPAGETDSIDTDISTLPIQLSEYRTFNNVKYYGLFPIMKQNSTKQVGYRTMLYLGMTPELDGNGMGVLQYPMLSSTNRDSLGNIKNEWSNVYRHYLYQGSIGESDAGLINYWWKNFLPVLQYGEENEAEIYLPLHELAAHQWDDVILIQNIPYIVKSIVEPYPYKNYVQATLKRLVKEQPEEITVTDPDTGTELKIYAKLIVNNINSFVWGIWMAYVGDITVSLYSDEQGTIPYNSPQTFYVLVQKTTIDSGVTKSETLDYYGINGNSQRILQQTHIRSVRSSNGVVDLEYTYTLSANNNTNYVII